MIFIIYIGTTTEGGSLSTRLLYTEIPTVSDASCQTDYGKDEIFESMLCAGQFRSYKLCLKNYLLSFRRLLQYQALIITEIIL